MHQDLILAFERIIANLKKDNRCKGGWHYGSISRGEQDLYSDYDPVFLVSGSDFEHFALDVPKILEEASDEVLIFWGEGFNDAHFKNYCSIIRLGENLHQLDFFLINEDSPEAWMCRQHCKGCSKEHIIFDRSGEVAAFLEKGYYTDNDIPDTVRAMDTYWFHIEMLIKYFKRKDIFKLIKNMDILFHAHVDLLLSHYDTLEWGGWESKVKHCVPQNLQEHLKIYFSTADYPSIEAAIKKGMLLFREDAEVICSEKGIEYPQRIPNQIIAYFCRRLEEDQWE